MTAFANVEFDRADVVTFDVFDTLLTRNVIRPTDVFLIAKEICNCETAFVVNSDVASARIAAEVNCRETAVAQGRNPDTVSFDDIYAVVRSTLDYPASLIDALRDCELEAERRLLVARESVVDLFDEAKRRGKTVAIVSDMYLPKTFVAECLERNGISGWEVFLLSGEDKVCKSDGSAFAKLREMFGSARIVHVGDNPQSDGIQAERAGIETVRVSNWCDDFRSESTRPGRLISSRALAYSEAGTVLGAASAQKSIVNGLIARRIEVSQSDGELLGYALLGPLLVGFVQWLHRLLAQRENTHAYFLARDGFIMHAAYNEYWESEAISSTYTFASRRIFNFAAIGDTLGEQDLAFLVQTSHPIVAIEYFNRLEADFDRGVVGLALSGVGLKPTSLIVSDEDRQRMRSAFKSIEPEIARAAKRERESLIRYFCSVGIFETQDIGIVDIGWHGSLQYALLRILRSNGCESPVRGFYFGLHDENRRITANLDRSAYVNGAVPADSGTYESIVRPSVSLLELLFTSADPTMLSVGESESGFEPRVGAEYRSPTELELVDELHRGAIEFVRDFRDATKSLPPILRMLDRTVATANLSHMMSSPSPGAARALGSYSHADGLGTNVSIQRIGSPRRTRGYYLRHPTMATAEYLHANWPAGYLVNAQSIGIRRLVAAFVRNW